MKTFNTSILLGLLVIGGAMNASQAPAPDAANIAALVKAAAEGGAAGNGGGNGGSSSWSNLNTIALGAVLALGSWVGKDAYDWIKKQIVPCEAKKEEAQEIKNELENLTAELALVSSQNTGLYQDWKALCEIYNGGNNVKINKEEVQAQINKLWQAYKDNSAEKEALALKIKSYRAKLAEKHKATAPQVAAQPTLAQLTQAGIATKPATPALLASSVARTA